jgi:hypothetical protein
VPCAVVFGATSEGRDYVVLPLDADEVGKRLRENSSGWERFEDDKGRAIWINAANVRYVEQRSKGGPQVDFVRR